MVDMQIGMRCLRIIIKKEANGGTTCVHSLIIDDIIDQIDSISINIHKLNSLWVKTYIKTISNSRSAQNSVKCQ